MHLNKIPILICGKPGCSKSLAISLIVSGLRGDKSQDSYFKTLPELQIVSFQGSDSCTSEGISQVFERAKQFTKHKHLLPVVVFDEIGLAEISRHNPLKVLHELLENENRDVGFIGISNWRLDASKMNRALYLARPDPDQEDLTSTAVSILYSIVGESYEYEEFIRIIAESYFQLKEYFKTGDWADFYGLRDFYYLVKQLSNEFKKGPLDIYQVLEKIKRAIERNFGGKLRAAKTLGEIFCKKYQNSEAYKSIEKTQICDMITENLSEKDSRYLLLITRPDVASYLIESVLSAEIPDFRVLIGSKFEKDLAKEDSGFRALSDIIRYMERGISVILSNMDHTYSSLYDLFNQNFSKTGQRKYCRVALGAQFNPRCFVHDKFKVIVFMDESTKTLKAADAPFLNRFEKHHITLDEIIEVQQKNIADEINLWVENIFTFEQGPGKVLLNKVSIFPCFSKETIYLMVIFLRESGVQDEEITQICKNILLETAPIDVIILSQFSNLPSAEKEFINATWKEIHQVPFISYIQGLQGETIISLTYDVKNIDLELTEAFAEEITLQKVCNFQSEEDVLQDLRSFFKSERSNIYLLEMDYGRESVHFHLIISLIEKAKKEAMKDLKNQKNVCFLIRMSRNDTTRKPLSIFRLWNIRMFESLSTTPFTLTEEIITYDLSTIIQSENLIKFDELISEFAEISINSLKFQSAIYGFEEFSQQRDLIEKKLIEDPELAQGFKWKIFNAIEKNLKGRQELWGKQIFLDKQVVFEANCALDALKRYAAKFLVNQYLKLVFLIEKKSAFYSYSQICHHEELKNIWLSVFEKIGASDIMVQTTIQSNLVTFYKDLNFPFVLDEYSKVKDLYKLFANETENFTIENFIQNYREKSVWKDHLYLICENEELQQMIFKDFIKIVLHESVCVDIYVDEIFRIFLSIFRSESFEKKLLNFMEHKKFIMPLYKVLEIHMKCKGKHLDFEFENAEFFDLVGNLFDQIIEEIPPASDVIKNCKGQGNYLLLLQELELYFEKFDGLDLKSQQKHEFWMQICRINSIEKLLYSLASELYHQPFEYLTSNSFSDYLLEQVKKIEKTPFNLEKIQKFLLIYHCQLLDAGQGKPEHLIDEINSTEIWKYSSIFIDKLIEMAEISENIKWNERNPDMNQVIGDTENENVEVIEKLLGSLQDNFAVLLGDKLRLEFGEIDEEMIEAIPRLFRFYTSSLENEVGEFQNLSKIVALTRIRAILEWFSKRLFANKSNRAVLVDSYREMVRNLENSDFLYQLFVYKRVKFTEKWKNPKLVKSLIDLDIAWMDPLKEIAFTTDLTTFPIVEIDMALYKSLQLSIFTLSEDQNACDSILHSTKSSHSRLLLAIAFINCVFLQYHNSHFDPEPFISWFLAKQDLIRQELGHVFSTFLQNLIMNFPRGSFLFINPEIKQERIDLQAILLIIAETVAYCNTPNPISNMFFNAQGNFSIDTFNSVYCIGSEPEKIHNYLLYTLQNYDNLKNIGFSNRISKGGSYVCSENCDFLYIVNQCGGAMETKNCPFCGNEIGGKDHIIVKRKGHINLTDAEAVKFLKEKTNFYAKNEKVGFEVQGDLPITNVRTMRNRLGFHLANLITSSFLYFAVVTDLGDLGGLEMRYGSSRDALENMVKKNICQDFSEISAMISIEPTVWVLACASQLWTLMDAFVGKPASQEIRNSFEEKIESEILFKYQTLEILNRYKITLNQYTPQSNLLSQIDELEVPEGPSEYFRIIETPSFDTMTASFELSNKKSQLKVLSYFIENNAEIKNLKCLYPIVKLTNYLLEKYSFSISRYEASKKTLRSFSSTDPKLKILFEKFNIAWEKITLPLVNGCKTFEKLELTEETSLSYFLPDEDINGDGRYITAALKTIGNVQNNLLKLLIRENSHSSHPVQQCKRSDIISFSLGKKELTKQCSLNSLKYSMGREIIYDFDRMQLNIVSDIRNKKIFNTEDIYMVQYQFELLNTRGRYSGIISGIRENIKQESIGPTEIAQIEKKILFLSKRQGKEVKIVYKEIYSLFDKLFCNIQYSKNCEEIPVIEACKKVKGVSSYIAESQIFDGFQLNTIVALYEMIELNCYELIASFIGEMYKIDIDINVFEFEFRKMNEEFAGRTGERLEGEIEKVLKRIVLRLLSANVEPNFFIRDYLECEGFWSQEYLRYIDHVSSIFPQEYKLCQAVRIVEEIEENNKRAIRKLESVEETKVVKEQGIKKMKQSFNTGVKKKAKF